MTITMPHESLMMLCHMKRVYRVMYSNIHSLDVPMFVEHSLSFAHCAWIA